MVRGRGPSGGLARAVLLLVPRLAACGGPSEQTGIIAEVSTDLRVPVELDEVRVAVTAPGGAPLYQQSFPLAGGADHYSLPMRVGFFPQGNDGPVRIEAAGWLGDTMVVSRSATLSFLRGRVVVVPLPLLAVCAGRRCAVAEETCVESGRCQPDTVDPNGLPIYRPGAEGGSPGDGDGDAAAGEAGDAPDAADAPDASASDTGARDVGAPDFAPDFAPDLGAPADARVEAGAVDGGPTTTSLVGWWTFDQAGTVYPDRSGNGNDARVGAGASPPPTWLATLDARAGVVRIERGQSWLEVAASPSLNTVTTAFTMAAWVYVEPHSPMLEQAIVTRQIGPQTVFGLSVADTGALQAFVETQIRAPAALPTQTWVHVAATYDGQLAKLYVNGAMTGATYAVSGPPLAPTTKALIIGARNNDVAGIYEPLVDGKIDDVVLYARALGAAEVAALASGASPMPR